MQRKYATEQRVKSGGGQAGGSEYVAEGFSAHHDSWVVNMQSLMAIRQSEERHSSTCCTVSHNSSEVQGIMILGSSNKNRVCLLPQTDS